ncbi:MAG: hypothetical protein JNJ48_08740 [Phycisphaerae bacterium]|nr:hypothetical protein [Phycisphaerae bacterium]
MAKSKRASTRGGGLSNLTVADLQRELTRRQRSTRTLIKQRARLQAKLDALDAKIRAAGVQTGGRARNSMSLAEALAKLLKGKTMRVNEAADAVRAAGYQSNAENFRTMVNLQLIKSGKFKRVGRGRYTTA